jgi:hypothetical protein
MRGMESALARALGGGGGAERAGGAALVLGSGGSARPLGGGGGGRPLGLANCDDGGEKRSLGTFKLGGGARELGAPAARGFFVISAKSSFDSLFLEESFDDAESVVPMKAP